MTRQRKTNHSITIPAVAIAASLTVVGCAQLNGDTIKDIFLPSSAEKSAVNGIDPILYLLTAGVVDTITGLISDDVGEDVTLSPEQARNFPYAAQYLRLADNPRLLTVLAFADRSGSDASQVRLHWASVANEIIETNAQQRLLAMEQLLGEVPQLYFAGDNSALACYASSINGANCPTEAQWAMDITQQKQPFSSVDPHYIEVREQATVNYRVVNQAVTITLANGDAVQAVQLQEQASDGSFSNDFYIANGRVVKSRQWLGQTMGYLEIEQVQAWGDPGQPAAPPASSASTQVTINATTLNLPAQPRISQVLEQLASANVGDYYSPLIRLSSCELDQEFRARKQGMLVRLRLLQQSYRADGEADLLKQAIALEKAFMSWPLRATHIHGASLPKARLSLGDNKQLPMSDCGADTDFTLSFGSPQPVQQVGIYSADQARSAWVVRANGEVSFVNLQGPDERRSSQALLAQPNSLVLYGIAESDLPDGFRDVNQQLALFLQHWDFSHAQR